VIVAGGALAVVGALALAKPKPAAPAAPPVPPAGPVDDKGTAGAGAPAQAFVPPAPITAGPPPPAVPFLSDLTKELPKELGGLGKVAGQIGVGLQVADAIGQGVAKLAGEGAGNLARIAMPAAVGFAVKGGVERLLDKVGVKSGSTANKLISQTAGVAAATGGLGVPIKLAAEGVSKVIGLIDKKAEQDTRTFFRNLDPSNHRNVTAAPFAAVGNAIKGLGGLFGKKK
jgi:hypothetical protein